MDYTRSKIPFLCSDNELQIFKYPPFEWTLYINTYRINFVYQKMELQSYTVYLWKKKLQWHCNTLDFFRKTISESRRWCNVSTGSENRRRKHVVTTLVFSRSRRRKHNVVTTLSDVATKIQLKPNVVTTSCASWENVWKFRSIVIPKDFRALVPKSNIGDFISIFDLQIEAIKKVRLKLCTELYTTQQMILIYLDTYSEFYHYQSYWNFELFPSSTTYYYLLVLSSAL